jgi:sulfide dehydrogenase cytochrome subunit
MKKTIILSLAGLISVAVPFTALLAGSSELTDKCDTCHGKDGRSEDGKVPSIGGMSETYLHDTMMAYRSGDRPGVKYKPKQGDETDMNAVAKKLSESDINAVATHYSNESFVAHPQNADAGQAAKGKKVFAKFCEKCHSEGGSVADDDAGILTGQWKPYLEEQFKMFTNGSRPMPKKMAKKFKAVDEGELAAIAEFLAGGGK